MELVKGTLVSLWRFVVRAVVPYGETHAIEYASPNSSMSQCF